MMCKQKDDVYWVTRIKNATQFFMSTYIYLWVILYLRILRYFIQIIKTLDVNLLNK